MTAAASRSNARAQAEFAVTEGVFGATIKGTVIYLSDYPYGAELVALLTSTDSVAFPAGLMIVSFLHTTSSLRVDTAFGGTVSGCIPATDGTCSVLNGTNTYGGAVTSGTMLAFERRRIEGVV